MFPVCNGGFNITFLCGLIAAKEQQDDLVAGIRIINTVTGAVMYSQLKYPGTHIFVIAYITKFYPFEPGSDTSKGGAITQTIKPFLERLFSHCVCVVGKLVWSCLHAYFVSYTILGCK